MGEACWDGHWNGEQFLRSSCLRRCGEMQQAMLWDLLSGIPGLGQLGVGAGTSGFRAELCAL